jgi:hypothetical protein
MHFADRAAIDRNMGAEQHRMTAEKQQGEIDGYGGKRFHHCAKFY